MPDSPPAATEDRHRAARIGAWPDWPEFGLVEDLLPTLQGWAAAGRRFALATLVEVVGSAPRPAGTEMAISELGECVGYLSGGCVEAAVAEEATRVLAGGGSRVLDYGAGSPFLDVQLSCGGRIRVVVREIEDAADYVAGLADARRARRPASVETRWDVGGERGRFVRLQLPLTRVVVVGGEPSALALARLAGGFGYEVVLLRPKGPGEPPAGMPLIAYDRRSIDAALADLQLDAWCAVYTLTHDFDTDHAVLMRALASESFAIGALGSQRKAEQRRRCLREAGVPEAALARVHTPAGLDIGGHLPGEVALSILAQIVAQRPR